MWQGNVVSIYTAPTAGAAMTAVPESSAIAGRGLRGDRYGEGEGFYSAATGPHREVTLIEEEVLEALQRDHHLDLPSGIHRRNIVTRGVPLGHLVGRSFTVGEAILRGVKISEPCQHLVDITGIPGILSPLIHRGGLNAEVLQGGLIRIGDAMAATD